MARTAFVFNKVQYIILFGARPFLCFIIVLSGVKQMIGQKLIDLRQQRHWSQQQLAKKLGVHEKTIKNWENENADPGIKNLVNICNIFNITADELLGRDTRYLVDAGSLEQDDRKKLNAIVQAFMDACIHG